MRRVAQNGVRDRRVVGQRLTLFVASYGKHQLALLASLQEHVTTLGTRQVKRRLDQRDQHFLQHATGVELARGFQEQCERVQLGDGAWRLRRLPTRYLAQEL